MNLTWARPRPRPARRSALRAAVTALAGPFVAEPTGLDRPWRLLREHVANWHLEQSWFGIGYLAHGSNGTGHGPTVPG